MGRVYNRGMTRLVTFIGLAALITGGACSSSSVQSTDAGGGADRDVAAACGCEDGLAVDIQGDGDPVHLTSGDYTAAGRSDLGYANLASTDVLVRPDTVLTSCLSKPMPWAASTTGQGSVVYWLQACAGPGSAPPCFWLSANNSGSGALTSLYIDRAGQAFRANATSVGTSFRAFQTPLASTIDGQFTLALEDGRTLSGTLRVCVLASINFD